MLVKLYLTIGGKEYELQPEEVCNWEDVKCSYKRSDYDAIMRTFTSKFEFANRARDLLLAEYVAKQFAATASLSVRLIQNDWTYKETFACNLDFTSVQWDDYKLTIGCLDNDLAAIIKANKGTKYEWKVGRDISNYATMTFTRIPMQESATYKFTQGENFENLPDIYVTFEGGTIPWLGNVGSEVLVNRTVFYQDDQENNNSSYVLKAVKDVDVTLEFMVRWRHDQRVQGTEELYAYIRRGGSYLSANLSGGSGGMLGNIGSGRITMKGTYTSPSQLPSVSTAGNYAIVDGIVWEARSVRGTNVYEWESTGKTFAEYEGLQSQISGKATLKLKAGDEVVIDHKKSGGASGNTTVRIIDSSFVFGWTAKDEAIDIPVMKPEQIGKALMRSLTGSGETGVTVSLADERMKKTWLMAAESVRGIPGAKFYSSFTEFCDWMKTVFGYTYYIGTPPPCRFKRIMQAGSIATSPSGYEQTSGFNGAIKLENIVYMVPYKLFLYYDPDSKKYYRWFGTVTSDSYNGKNGEGIPEDTLFRFYEEGMYRLYYFNKGDTMPRLYEGGEDDVRTDENVVNFVPRSMIYPSGNERSIENVTDVKCDADASVVYSEVTVGYEKQDYDSANGRDEFNFGVTYTTGCTTTDKKLSLTSKYRADCYGIEYAAIKRHEESTDSDTDQTVFFMYCRNDGEALVPDTTTYPVTDALNAGLMNGAYSPAECAKANADIIALMGTPLTLTFASSTGNSEVKINGKSLADPLQITGTLIKGMTLTFTTDDVDDIADPDEIVSIVSRGNRYRGYIKEVDVRYSKPQSAEYKLIVKDITLWQ